MDSFINEYFSYICRNTTQKQFKNNELKMNKWVVIPVNRKYYSNMVFNHYLVINEYFFRLTRKNTQKWFKKVYWRTYKKLNKWVVFADIRKYYSKTVYKNIHYLVINEYFCYLGSKNTQKQTLSTHCSPDSSLFSKTFVIKTIHIIKTIIFYLFFPFFSSL